MLICGCAVLQHLPLTYSYWGFQDTKILVRERKVPSQAQEQGCINKRFILPLFQRKIFPEIAELEWQIFQAKKEDSFDTHARTHAQNLEFSADYGVQPQLFMFKFDSHQVLIYLLLCYVILVRQLYFWFQFLLYFICYFPFWFLIDDLWYLT